MTIKQNPDNPIAPEVLAEAVRAIGQSLKQWNKAGVKRLTLVVLLKESTGLSKRDIESVLDAIDSLERHYLISQPQTK